MSLLVLTAADVDRITAIFTPAYLLDLMTDVFAVASSPTPSLSYSPARLTVPTERHTALMMPARIAGTGTAVKVVSVPTSLGDKNGLPASTMILDPETGAVQALVNAGSLTALRNAGGSLLSAKIAGVEHPTSIVAFGAGQQIHAHLDLFIKAYPSIKTCTIVNRTLNDRLDTTVRVLRDAHPNVIFRPMTSTAPVVETTSTEELKACLSQASIVICATSSEVALFPSSWINNYTHVVLIGSYKETMREVDDQLIMRAVPSASFPKDKHRAPLLLVDSRAACFKEAGEIISAGIRPGDVVEIGEVNAAATPLSDTSETGNSGPITLFKSVGIALQDVAIACAVLKRARELRADGETIGVEIPNF